MERYRPSNAVRWAAERLLAIDGVHLSSGLKLHESSYRFDPEDQPDASIDGMFYIDARDLLQEQPSHGNQRVKWKVALAIMLGFHASVGAPDGAEVEQERKRVNMRAIDDCQAVIDALHDPGQYRGGETGIQTVFVQGTATRIAQANRSEVWAIPIVVTVDSAWVLTPAGTGP